MPTKILVNANGPLKLEGDFTLVDPAGNEFSLGGKTTIFLCRCGQTKNSPFCDGQHKACNFTSPSQAR